MLECVSQGAPFDRLQRAGMDEVRQENKEAGSIDESHDEYGNEMWLL